MTDDSHAAAEEAPIRVLGISSRSLGPATLETVLVDYIVEGEAGRDSMWLNEFLEEHTDRVVVPDA